MVPPPHLLSLYSLSFIQWNTGDPRGAGGKWRAASLFKQKGSEGERKHRRIPFFSITRKPGKERVGGWAMAGGMKVRRGEGWVLSRVRGLGRSYACVFDVCNPLSPSILPPNIPPPPVLSEGAPDKQLNPQKPPGWGAPLPLFRPPTPSSYRLL